MEKEDKVITFAKKEPRTIKEIMENFNIPESQKMTLRRRLWSSKVIMKESRGRKKLVFG